MRWKVESVEDRFDRSYVPEPNSGCWLWIGQAAGRDYGELILRKEKIAGKWRKVRIKAHRLAWKLFRGPIPSDLKVLHHCDIGFCVNPDHLFLGTNKDNTADMVAKKRHYHGEGHHMGKLTEAQVREIRASSDSLAEAAARYGIAFQTVSEIRLRKIWKHV
jgi:HNH endonuclease